MPEQYTLDDAQSFEQIKDYAKAAAIYAEHGEHDKALALYHELERLYPRHKDIKFKLGRLLCQMRHWDEAITKFQEIKAGGGRYEEDALYLLAECFTQKGMLYAAKDTYVDLLDRNYTYKDARDKLRALTSPGLAEMSTTQPLTASSHATQMGGAANAPHQTMQGLSVEDRYLLQEELGRGGMGVVYKAQDSKLRRSVALKVLPPYLAGEEMNRLRFFREAKIIAKLRHPHIVKIFHVSQQENFIAMEYLPGGTLMAWQQQHSDSIAQPLIFLTQILDALHLAHEQGIIHRDLKPENILIADANTAKLTDFGIAHICGATITHTGTHLGTIPYMSPEQIFGSAVDRRTDIYAVGVMLYELLTGTLPFSGQDTSYHHIHTPPRPPREVQPNLAPELNAMILKCLQKRPDRRYQDAATLRQKLLTYLQSLAQR